MEEISKINQYCRNNGRKEISTIVIARTKEELENQIGFSGYGDLKFYTCQGKYVNFGSLNSISLCPVCGCLHSKFIKEDELFGIGYEKIVNVEIYKCSTDPPHPLVNISNDEICNLIPPIGDCKHEYKRWNLEKEGGIVVRMRLNKTILQLNHRDNVPSEGSKQYRYKSTYSINVPEKFKLPKIGTIILKDGDDIFVEEDHLLQGSRFSKYWCNSHTYPKFKKFELYDRYMRSKDAELYIEFKTSQYNSDPYEKEVLCEGEKFIFYDRGDGKANLRVPKDAILEYNVNRQLHKRCHVRFEDKTEWKRIKKYDLYNNDGKKISSGSSVTQLVLHYKYVHPRDYKLILTFERKESIPFKDEYGGEIEKYFEVV
jgi:hypothetical protein